jgi:hypothetical protein
LLVGPSQLIGRCSSSSGRSWTSNAARILPASGRTPVEHLPTMTFRSTEISGRGTDWTVPGELTIGPLQLDVEFGGIEEFPGGPRPGSTSPRRPAPRSWSAKDQARRPVGRAVSVSRPR